MPKTVEPYWHFSKTFRRRVLNRVLLQSLVIVFNQVFFKTLLICSIKQIFHHCSMCVIIRVNNHVKKKNCFWKKRAFEIYHQWIEINKIKTLSKTRFPFLPETIWLLYEQLNFDMYMHINDNQSHSSSLICLDSKR